MWEEAVTCLRIADEIPRALAVVRRQLETRKEPNLLCVLGELTGDDAPFHEAWEVSRHRCARAKRTLGRRFFERGDFEGAVEALETAVAINSLYSSSWFTLGCCGMNLERWDTALRSFSRVVAIDPDAFEAWGNLGSVHLRTGHFEQAHVAIREALRCRAVGARRPTLLQTEPRELAFVGQLRDLLSPNAALGTYD